MDARILALPFDPAALRRLSPGLVTSHHQNPCAGASKRPNAVRVQPTTAAFATVHGFQLNGAKSDELITPTRCCCMSSASAAWAATPRRWRRR